MVPPTFDTFFATIAGAGAALLGLLFIAISITPEQTVKREAPLERQVLVSSCFLALCNPFFIALIALIPSLSVDAVGVTTLAVGIGGLSNTFILGWLLLRQLFRVFSACNWGSVVHRTVFILVGLALYGCECSVGALLINSPNASVHLPWLVLLLVFINALGLFRAWDLLGAHHFGFQDLLKPPHDVEKGRQRQARTLITPRHNEDIPSGGDF